MEGNRKCHQLVGENDVHARTHEREREREDDRICTYFYKILQQNNTRKLAYIGIIIIILFLIVNIETLMNARDAIAIPGDKLVSE